ncbi:MAG: hypothetical protein KDN22_16885, partial [Verrucomicrobiae bacterium]|nr:hypothetical protein [Verrucomicrobiae bacterium]
MTLFKVGQGQVLREFILSIDRKYPLIVFNGDSPAQLSEAKALAIKLAGKAQVLIIKENPELAEELRYVLERDYQIRFGQMRVFFPVNVRRPMPTKHRWFDVSSPFYQEQRQGIINGLLRNHNLVEQGAISSLQDIRRLISRSKLEKLKQTEIGDSANLDEIFQFVKIAENERDEAKAEAAAYAQQVDELEATVSQLEWKEKALETINGGNSSTVESSLFSLPKNILEVVEAAAKIHVGRLEFCKEAFSSAERDKSCEMVAEAWEIISHLASTLHELKFKSSDPGDIAQRFTDESGYEYAKTEGKATKADARLRGLRRINHKGRDFEIWPHIKKGYPLIDSG